MISLGIRRNLSQFTLLVVVNGFVGAMVGMERSILPAVAEREFYLAARTAILSFIVVFGVTKALTNYLAGRLSDAYGRKAILVFGWLVTLPELARWSRIVLLALRSTNFLSQKIPVFERRSVDLGKLRAPVGVVGIEPAVELFLRRPLAHAALAYRSPRSFHYVSACCG